MSKTIKEKIQLGAIKLYNLIASLDQIFFNIAMTQYERYITYSILGALGLMKICVLVFCYKLQKVVFKVASIIDRNDANVRELISKTGHEFQSKLRSLICESGDDL